MTFPSARLVLPIQLLGATALALLMSSASAKAQSAGGTGTVQTVPSRGAPGPNQGQTTQKAPQAHKSPEKAEPTLAAPTPEQAAQTSQTGSDPDAELDEDAVVTRSPAKSGPPLDHVKAQLMDLQKERESTTNLWPWLVLGVGLGATVGSATYGAIYAIDCDHDCSTPNWVSLTVVAGAAVAALSMLWLVRTDDQIRELESRKYHLERDLERMSTASRTLRSSRAQASLFSFQF
jgi:hypothetical protein